MTETKIIDNKNQNLTKKKKKLRVNVMNITHFFSGNRSVDDLSPVSSLRLNFDQLPIETTDTVNPTKNVFGVAVPAQYVPERIISWLDNNDGASNYTNQSDLTPNSTTSDKVIFSNNDLNNPIIKKVWIFPSYIEQFFFLYIGFKIVCGFFFFFPFVSLFEQVDNVRMIDRYNIKNPTIGTLYITATHIIFVDPETNKETWVSCCQINNTLCFVLIQYMDNFHLTRYFICILETLKNCNSQPLVHHY